jgi:hypothetical protein
MGTCEVWEFNIIIPVLGFLPLEIEEIYIHAFAYAVFL